MGKWGGIVAIFVLLSPEAYPAAPVPARCETLFLRDTAAPQSKRLGQLLSGYRALIRSMSGTLPLDTLWRMAVADDPFVMRDSGFSSQLIHVQRALDRIRETAIAEGIAGAGNGGFRPFTEVLRNCIRERIALRDHLEKARVAESVIRQAMEPVQLQSDPSAKASAATFLPDGSQLLLALGKTVVAVDPRGKVPFIERARFLPDPNLRVFEGMLTSVASGRNGIVVGSDHNNIFVWDPGSAVPETISTGKAQVEYLLPSASGDFVLSIAREPWWSPRIGIIDLREPPRYRRLRYSFGLDSPALSAVVSSDQKYIHVLTSAGKILQIDIDTLKLDAVLDELDHTSFQRMAISTDATLTAMADTSKITIRNTRTREVVVQTPITKKLSGGTYPRIEALAFSPKGRYLVAIFGTMLWIHDIAIGETKVMLSPSMILTASGNELAQLAFSPDESVLITTSGYGKSVRWNLESIFGGFGSDP